MPRYRGSATVIGGKFLGEVEASSAEEARRMFEESDAASVSVCHHCAEQIVDPEIGEIHVELAEDDEDA